MNWKRIWTGALLAGAAAIGVDTLVNHVILGSTWHALVQAGQIYPAKPYFAPILIILDIAIGFVLTWLYVLARPRLGPGPKTATVMGSIAWFLLGVPTALMHWLWFPLPISIIVVTLVGDYAKCWIGSYLGGWQYMEKAP